MICRGWNATPAAEGWGLLTLVEMEPRYIAKVLESTGYNKGLTARVLDILWATLWRKSKMFGLG